jgi:hypothetical protein
MYAVEPGDVADKEYGIVPRVEKFRLRVGFLFKCVSNGI